MTLTLQPGEMSPHTSEVTSSSPVSVTLMPVVENGFHVHGHGGAPHHAHIQATADVGDMDFWDLDFGTPQLVGNVNQGTSFTDHVSVGSTTVTIVNVGSLTATPSSPPPSSSNIGAIVASPTSSTNDRVIDIGMHPTVSMSVPMSMPNPVGISFVTSGVNVGGGLVVAKRRYFPSPASTVMCDSLSDAGVSHRYSIIFFTNPLRWEFRRWCS